MKRFLLKVLLVPLFGALLIVSVASATTSNQRYLALFAGAHVSGLIVGTGLGAPTAYAGFTCSANQYVTALTGSGVNTCAQVAASQVSGLSGTYALLASPTFTGTVTGPTINASTQLQQGGVPIQQLPTLFDTISATTYTLVSTDCGRTKYLTSGSATTITVPSSTLTVGCIVVFIADGAASTFTGSGLTLQLLGGTTTGNRAVANGGGITLQFVSNTKAFAGGPGVT